MHKELGKISRAGYGMGGYQDVQFGLSITLSGAGWSTGDFWGFWADKPGKSAQWTTEDQLRAYGATAQRIRDLLGSGKVDSVSKLVGLPVEAIFESPIGRLQSWRILSEVL